MQKVYSVGQINTYIKNLFASDYLLNRLYIKGEVSNCKYHSSGHIYFTIKDDTGALACVMFKSYRAKGLLFHMTDGQSVVVGGSVNVYERDGRYQFYAQDIILDGAGALYEEYERLKAELYAEGLFEFEHKKEIPHYPKSIGIVTAATGAAIEDIKNIAHRRNPYVQLILYPAKVQGENAAKTIVKGIQVLDQMQLDTIIVGRGGGSIEDLWAFNEEIVARAIYAAKTPIISGTGHEIDTTIADYVADLRAPTPSAACELAIPDYMGFLEQVRQIQKNMYLNMQHKLQQFKTQYHTVSMQLECQNPVSKVQQQRIYLDDLTQQMQKSFKQKMMKIRHQYELYVEQLHGLSPTGKLVNGFGYLEYNDSPLQSIKQINIDDSIKIILHDGKIDAKATQVKEETYFEE